MSDDANRTWLDTLAGRSPGADHEAQGLRRQLLARPPADGPDVLERDPAREEALLARARKGGLLPAVKPRTVLWRWPALVAAGLAGVALVAGLLFRSPEPTVRSGAGEIVRLTAADPSVTAERILHDLRAAGVEATAYERLGRHGIDADLPQPLPSSVRSVLRRHGIPEPSDGVLQVEIEPR
jgi:hypothetical protein